MNEGSPLPADQAVPDSSHEQAAATSLRAENERLVQRIQELEQERECDRRSIAALEKERDAYCRAAYARALEQITDEDVERYAQQEEGLPLDALLEELEPRAHPNGDA